MKRRTTLLTIGLLISILIGNMAYSQEEKKAAAQLVEGECETGAKYLLALPNDWNGDLVVYAHGFMDTAEPITLPTKDDIEALQNLWTSNGYAVAYSSYSKYGFAVSEGAMDTLCLNDLFKCRFGPPKRTFLVGHSLGGLVCVKLSESLGKYYAGVLTVAGMIGGSQAEIDYMSNVRILFELHYPGVLPGAVDAIPPGLDLNADVVNPIMGAIQTNPTNAVGITMIDQTPLPWATDLELVQAYATSLGFWYRGSTDLAERSGSRAFFGNKNVKYTSSILPSATMEEVNAAVDRYEALRHARKYFHLNYEPTGRLCVPHLALHNARDPVVPVFHLALYAELVAEQGRKEMLVRRVIDRYGHTENFTADEVFEAFEELVEWVNTGVEPVP